MTTHPPLAGNPRGAVAFLFNQPMAAAAQRRKPAAEILAKPDTPGSLQWLGDRTLVFIPQVRFRYSTQYELTLKPGLAARSGARLGQAVVTGFTTSTPDLVSSTPVSGAGELDPLPTFTLRFNQPVRGTEVLRCSRLTGPAAPPLRLMPQPARDDHTVLLQPREPLYPGSPYTLLIPPGLRGREGPLRSVEPIRLQFTTAGPLRLLSAGCGARPCHPGDPIVVQASGSASRACAQLVATPRPEGLYCRPRGRTLILTGAFRAASRYLLTLRRGAAGAPPPVGLQVQLAPREPPLAFFPNRPLLAVWSRAGRLPASAGRPGSLRLATVNPAVVPTLLTAIADPSALPPFHLASGLQRTVALRPKRSPDVIGLGGGHPALVLAALEGPAGAPTGPAPRRAVRRTALLQLTELALIARYDWNAGVALVTGLQNGAPQARVTLTLRDAASAALWRGRTDAAGLAHFPGRRQLRRTGPFTLWAERGADRSFVVLDGGGEDDFRTPGYLPGQRPPAVERVVGAVFSDRRRYRPGSWVRLFGALRGQTRTPRGGLGHLSAHLQQLAWRVVSEAHEEIAAGQTRIGPAGLFRVECRLPRHAQTGRYTAWLHLPGARGDLADWVLGSFHVDARQRTLGLTITAPEQEALLDRSAVRDLVLRERNGRPVAGASVRWWLYRQPADEEPPGYPAFRFGRAEDPTISPKAHDDWDPGEARWPEDAVWIGDGEGTTDGQGRLALRPRLAAPAELRAARFELIAEATTLDGRNVKEVHSVVARRQPLQLGLQTGSLVATVGAPLPVQLLAVSGNGTPRPLARVQVTAHRYDGLEADKSVAARCESTLLWATGSCALRLSRPGRFLLRVTAMAERASPAETVIYVHSPTGPQPPPAQTLEVIPEREIYREGAVARVLLRSPVTPATALLTLERDGIAHAQTVTIRRDTMVSLPLGRGLSPGAWIGVTVAGALSTKAPAVESLSERVRIQIQPPSERLRVTVTAARTRARPDSILPVTLGVTDSAGAPVPASLLVLLQPDTADNPIPDLLRELRHERGPGVAVRTTAAHLARARPHWRSGQDPEVLATDSPSQPPRVDDPEAAPPTDPTGPPPPALFFRGPALTDQQGRLRLSVPMPRERGSYRLVVLAADRNLPHRVGTYAHPLFVSPDLSLTVRTPTLLRVGDRITLEATLQNHTSQHGVIDVHARAHLAPIAPALRTLRVAPGERRRVRFTVTATRAGLAQIQLAAVMGSRVVTTQRRVVVESDPEGRVLAQMGSVRGAAVLPLRDPGAKLSRPAPGPLSLTLSTSPLGIGLNTLRWLLLRDVPTLEGAATRLLALAIARQPGAAALLERLPDARTRVVLCIRAVRQLLSLRLKGGGMRRYGGGPPAQVSELGLARLALHRAHDAGCKAPRRPVSALTQSLRRIATNPQAEWVDRVAALAALTTSGDYTPPRHLTAVLRRWRKLPTRALAQLLTAAVGQRSNRVPALRRALARRLAPRPPGGEDADRIEAMARLLLALGKLPAAQAPRLQTWIDRLLAAAHDGHWRSARAATWALLALASLDRRQAHAGTPTEVRAWLDGRYWGGRQLRVASLDVLRLRTSPKPKGRWRQLVLQSRGAQPAYYRVSLPQHGSAHSPLAAPATVAVHFTTVGDRRSAPFPLRLAVGQNGVGRVTVMTTRSIPSTVLRVPVPAGCEVVDPGYPRLDEPSRASHWLRFPRLPVLDATLRGNVLWLYLRALPPGIHEHRLVIQATAAGRFGCSKATLRRAADDRQLTHADRCQPLRVTP